MTIADFLTFIGIVVSIVFGFIITRFCSIKDARTRMIKDYYIEQLKQIKSRVDKFYHRVAFGKLSARKIILWNDHIQLDIKSIDQGIRTSLNTHIEEFNILLDRYFAEITDWEDYNNQFSNSRYIPNNTNRERLLQIKYEIDEFLNYYIQHVNQANNFPFWIVQWRKIIGNYNYYKENGNNCPICCAIGERLGKHILEIIISLAAIIGIVCMYLDVEDVKKEDLATPLRDISAKQDSICKSIQFFIEKYEPVRVNTKTFNNSAFFNAERVDSVHVKLYQGK